MSEALHRYEKEEHYEDGVLIPRRDLVIYHDEFPSNPREDNDNLGRMVCFHGRYNLGDEHSMSTNMFSGWEAMEEYIRVQYNAAVILPLFLYDHGGITMNTTGFTCPWDSGQVGFIYVTTPALRAEYGVTRITDAVREKATRVLIAEVAEYDQYLSGNAYRYEIEDEEGNVIDSCGGYYEIEHILADIGFSEDEEV